MVNNPAASIQTLEKKLEKDPDNDAVRPRPADRQINGLMQYSKINAPLPSYKGTSS